MSAWRRKALELIPKLRPVIEKAESPMALWIELYAHFTRSAPNADDSTLRPILMYAFWCVSPAAGALPSDASTAVWCGFFENRGKRKELWGRFRAWFLPAQFKQISPAFMYFLSDEEMRAVNEAYYGSVKDRRPH